jgi:hypothetical protein
MIETVTEVHEPRQKRPPRYMREDPEWQMLASRN